MTGEICGLATYVGGRKVYSARKVVSEFRRPSPASLEFYRYTVQTMKCVFACEPSCMSGEFKVGYTRTSGTLPAGNLA